VDVIYMKACPKCAGDVELANGQDGKVLQCLQCSFTVDSPAAARRAVAELAKNVVAA
jgi:ribosomal protein S27AE